MAASLLPFQCKEMFSTWLYFSINTMGYLDWYHYSSQSLEICKYNSHILKCTIINLCFPHQFYVFQLLGPTVRRMFLPLSHCERNLRPWPYLALSSSSRSLGLSSSPPSQIGRDVEILATLQKLANWQRSEKMARELHLGTRLTKGTFCPLNYITCFLLQYI